MLGAVSFSFKVNCPSDFDCAPATECPEPSLPAPYINYLAKDYASFRKLILDRLAVTMPDWRERNPADLGIIASSCSPTWAINSVTTRTR